MIGTYQRERVIRLIQKPWVSDSRKMTVCVDSYEKGVPKGCFYNSFQEAERFESLSQFLMKAEALLDEIQNPQSYTATRRFQPVVYSKGSDNTPARIRKGAVATFEIQVLFRQHTSWQGVVIWKERGREQSFRSVLELVLLMDSALRPQEGNLE